MKNLFRLSHFVRPSFRTSHLAAFHSHRYMSNRASNNEESSRLNASEAILDPFGEDCPQNPPDIEETEQLQDENWKRAAQHIRNTVKPGSVSDLGNAPHPRLPKYDCDGKFENYLFPRKIWSAEECTGVKITHLKPEKIVDYLAYGCVQTMRFIWDLSTGYIFAKKLGITNFSTNQWLLRVAYLETVAGVPGMMFAMVRHLNSLRLLKRDHGWIHTLLSEAENERMHLLIALNLYKPNAPFRFLVLAGQGLMSNFFFLSYLASPRFCHRFVGYLEEEAVKTYSSLLADIETDKYPLFKEECSPMARSYWRLEEGSTWYDVFQQIRADEGHHRDVNHTLAPLSDKENACNPFRSEDIYPRP